MGHSTCVRLFLPAVLVGRAVGAGLAAAVDSLPDAVPAAGARNHGEMAGGRLHGTQRLDWAITL